MRLDNVTSLFEVNRVPLQGKCRAMANKMPNETRNVIVHMTTDLGSVRATHKKKKYE